MGFKSKTIKSILSRKIDKWIESIDDKDLREQLKKSVIVTGGAIVSMLQGEEVNDYDVYLRDHDTVAKVARYYVSKFEKRRKNKDIELKVIDDGTRVQIKAQSAGIATADGEATYKYFESQPDHEAGEYISSVMDNPLEIEDTYQDTKDKVKQNPKKSDGFKPVFLTSNAITLTDKIQIVLRFYGEPDEIHENYDFVHCTSYWTNWDNKLVLRAEALESILAKELKYVGSKYPICSIVRLRKFITRGWRINAGQILKMAFQISKLDLEDIATLEDQLTGVDTAYFVQMIERLKQKDPEKVDSAYLVELINELF